MKKIIFLIAGMSLGASLLAGQELKEPIIVKPIKSYSAITEIVFKETDKELAIRIQNRIKNEFGVDKEQFEQYLQEGVFTETDVMKHIETVTEEEIGIEVEKVIATIKPIPIEIITIALKELTVSPPNIIPLKVKEFIGADWDTISLAMQKLSMKEISILKTQILSSDMVETLYAGLSPKEIETLTMFIVDLSIPVKTRNMDDIYLRQALQRKDFVAVSKLLAEWEVPANIMNVIAKGLVQNREMFFVDAVMGENAYFIDKNYDRAVMAGDIVIVDVNMFEQRLKYAEFIKRNMGRDYAVMLGYEAMNNFDMSNTADFPMMAKNFEDFYILGKSIDPDLRIGLTVCLRSDNWKQWVEAMPFSPPDLLFVWNVWKTGGAFEKIAKIFEGYEIVIAGMNVLNTEGDIPNPPEYMKRLRDAGIKGSIWHK